MAKYALVGPTDIILEFRNYDAPPVAVTVSDTKPRLLPVVLSDVTPFNPVTEIKDGPTYTVRAVDVLEAYTKRAKTTVEVDNMRRSKIIELRFETFRRAELVMDEQEQRLYACLGVDMARSFGAYANWPAASRTVHDPLHTRWLQARDVFQIGLVKLQELRALTDPTAINAYDVTVGW